MSNKQNDVFEETKREAEMEDKKECEHKWAGNGTVRLSDDTGISVIFCEKCGKVRVIRE